MGQTVECSSNVYKHQTAPTYVIVRAAEEELLLKSQSSLEVLDHSKLQFLYDFDANVLNILQSLAYILEVT